MQARKDGGAGSQRWGRDGAAMEPRWIGGGLTLLLAASAASISEGQALEQEVLRLNRQVQTKHVKLRIKIKAGAFIGKRSASACECFRLPRMRQPETRAGFDKRRAHAFG